MSRSPARPGELCRKAGAAPGETSGGSRRAPPAWSAAWTGGHGAPGVAEKKPHGAVAAADDRASWKATIRTISSGSS